MSRRQQYGTGSIHRAHKKDCPHHSERNAKCGCIWRASVESGYTMSGGRRRTTVSAKTEPAVKQRLKELQRSIARGEEASGRTTLKAWAETWLEMTQHTTRPKTHITDKGAARWIVEAIGHKRLTDLTPADVRAVDTAIGKAGLSTSTALRYRGTLRRMLKAADAEGHAIPPRVLTVKPPTKAVNDRQAIPTPDVLRLLQAAGELPHGSRWLAAFLLGLRQGEALGLTWDQIGTDTLTVSWQLQPLPYLDKRDRRRGFAIPDGYEVRQLDRRMHLVRPKSHAGSRVLPLLPVLATSLDTWGRGEGLVWPALGGRPKEAHDDRDEWRRLQDAAEVRHPIGRHYMVHEIRHSTATLLLELGVPEAVRVQIMGHSTVASTNAYTHIDTALMREALTRAAVALKL